MKQYNVVCEFWSDCSGFAKPWIKVCSSYKEALKILNEQRKADWAEMTEGIEDEIEEDLKDGTIEKPKEENTNCKYHFWMEKWDYSGYIEMVG